MTEPREDIALELARKEFEEWAKGPKLPLKRDRTLYAEYMTQIAWDAWKAALLRPHVWEWIPVGERLPAEGETVLTAEDGSVTINYIPYRQSVPESRQGRFTSGHDYVTHWAALPSAPLSLESSDTK